MKKISRRSFLKGSALSAAAIGLTACGQAASAPAASSAGSASAAGASGDKVAVTYAFWGGEDEAKSTQTVVDTYNATCENTEVTCLTIPWENYMDKLNTMATANELPDCAMMNEAGCIKWATQDMLADISTMYGADESKPLDCLAFHFGGKTVAYSAANEDLVLFYNKDMFDKAGAEYPPTDAEKAWTWDEFVATAKKLTLDKNGKTPNDAGFDADNIVQYGCMIENLTWQLEVWCLSNGSGFYSADGSKVIINDPAAIEALQKIADLYLVDHVAPLSTGLTDDGVSRSLIAGTCAMTTNGTWNIGTCLAAARDEGLNYGVGVLPYMKEKVTICTGGPTVVFNQSEHPEEAMDFIKWYNGEDNNWDALIATGIWMPTKQSYYTDESLTHKWLDNPAYPAYEEAKPVLCDYAMKYAKQTAWYYVNNTDDFNTLLGSVLGDVWTGKATAEKAINGSYDALVDAAAGNA
jgi:multiple sugar transport system substrate-binding protein